jgi:hypothetical protein
MYLEIRAVLNVNCTALITDQIDSPVRIFSAVFSASSFREFRPGNVLFHVPAEFFGYTAVVRRVGFVEVNQLSGNDPFRNTLHGFSQITEELFLLAGIHQAEEITGLGVISAPSRG